MTCSARITTVSTSVAARTSRAEAHRTLLLGIRKCSISAAEAALGIPAVPYQAESLAPLGCFDRSHWTLAWAFVTEHLQNALPPDANPLAAVEPLTGTVPLEPGKPLAAVCAHSEEFGVSLPGQPCPSRVRLGRCEQLFL